jgi:transcriptional regulator with XRE-family HTH domain
MVLQLAGVSSVTVQMLRNGYIPKRQDTRQRIAAALGVSEAELFQIADAGRD